MSRLAVSAVAAACLGMTGCTVVRVDGAADVTTHFGVLRIVPAGPTGAVVVASQGFGIVPTSTGVVIGSSRERAVYIADASQCHAVFLVEDESKADGLMSVLHAKGIDPKTICKDGGK